MEKESQTLLLSKVLCFVYLLYVHTCFLSTQRTTQQQVPVLQICCLIIQYKDLFTVDLYCTNSFIVSMSQFHYTLYSTRNRKFYGTLLQKSLLRVQGNEVQRLHFFIVYF
jgi:hypothetical protein